MAEPRNILAFGERYPRHDRVVLVRNFRSRAEILTAAACCIALNELRHPKRLVAVRGGGRADHHARLRHRPRRGRMGGRADR